MHPGRFPPELTQHEKIGGSIGAGAEEKPQPPDADR